MPATPPGQPLRWRPEVRPPARVTRLTWAGLAAAGRGHVQGMTTTHTTPTTTQEIGKVTQYLREALATERALERTLEANIAITPGGAYKDALSAHHRQTAQHAERVQARLDDLGGASDLVGSAIVAAQALVGQAVAIGLAPLTLIRGASMEEKLLKNAKDAVSSEALEIATYDALERLAEHVGDRETAALAVSIRGDEERMMATLRELLPALTDRVARAELNGASTYDRSSTGAADAVRKAGARGRGAVSSSERDARRGARRLEAAAQSGADAVAEAATGQVDAVRDAFKRVADTAESGAESVVRGAASRAKGAERTAEAAVTGERAPAPAARRHRAAAAPARGRGSAKRTPAAAKASPPRRRSAAKPAGARPASAKRASAKRTSGGSGSSRSRA